MIERCKHIGKDGFRCGSHAFNLYKDDIEQGDLCDVHYWQTKAQRKPLTDEQIDEEFKLYASKFDTSSDKWLDMGADDYFKAGFKAAHNIKE